MAASLAERGNWPMSRVSRSILLFGLSVLLAAASAAGAPSTAAAQTAAAYSRTITINSGQIPSPQANFPMLVSVSDPALRSVGNGGHVAGANGSDIYFTDPTGATRYAHEIETYDGAAGTLVAWVSVPSISNGTQVKMWYGGDAVSGNATGVWANGFQGVWHMTAVNTGDSTANGNNTTAYGDSSPPAIASAPGKIDGALDFTPGGTYLSRDANPSLNFADTGSYTWEAWVNWDGPQSGGSGIFCKKIRPSVDGQGYVIYIAGGGGGGGWTGGNMTSQLRMMSSGSNVYSVSAYNVGPAIGQWQHVAVSYSNHSVRMYINGQPIQVLTNSNNATVGNTGTLQTSGDDATPFVIGWRTTAPNQSGSGSHWNGSLDELRYSNTERSADWIRAEYNNQSSPASFCTLGGEQATPVPPLIISQPASQSVTAGSNVAFTAGASGSPAPTVQWQVSVNSGGTWDNVSGAIVTTLSFAAQVADNGKQYRAVFTSTVGSAASNAATLTVVPPPSGRLGGGGGVGGGVPPAPGVTSLGPYTNSEGLFNLAVVAKSDDARLQLDIAKGVTARNQDGTPLRSIKVAPLDNPAPAPEGSRFIGLAYEATPEGATFSPGIALTICYDPASLPQSIAPDSLMIAVFNATSSQWDATAGTVDRASASVTANITHFSKYALTGKVAAPAMSPSAPPPALFAVSGVSVDPAVGRPGQTMAVSALVSNTGGSPGEFLVTFKVDGVVEGSQRVGLEAGASSGVTFTVVRSAPGEYAVDVNGSAASFTVEQAQPASPSAAPPTTTAAPLSRAHGTNWLVVVLVIAGVACVSGLVVLNLRGRRR